jgi:hypothetical protein
MVWERWWLKNVGSMPTGHNEENADFILCFRGIVMHDGSHAAESGLPAVQHIDA